MIGLVNGKPICQPSGQAARVCGAVENKLFHLLQEFPWSGMSHMFFIQQPKSIIKAGAFPLAISATMLTYQAKICLPAPQKLVCH